MIVLVLEVVIPKTTPFSTNLQNIKGMINQLWQYNKPSGAAGVSTNGMTTKASPKLVECGEILPAALMTIHISVP